MLTLKFLHLNLPVFLFVGGGAPQNANRVAIPEDFWHPI